MHPATVFLTLFGTASALQASSVASSNNTISSIITSGHPDGAVNIDLEDLAAERITKRKAMTYCANQESTSGMYANHINWLVANDTALNR
jgi:hypothetical protein